MFFIIQANSPFISQCLLSFRLPSLPISTLKFDSFHSTLPLSYLPTPIPLLILYLLLTSTSTLHFLFSLLFPTPISHSNFSLQLSHFHITVHFPHWKHRTSTYCTSLIGILSTFKKIPLSLYPQGPRFPR